MSTSASKPLKMARALPREPAKSPQLVAVPVTDDDALPVVPELAAVAAPVAAPVAKAIAQPAEEEASAALPQAEPVVKSQWSLAAGMWLWRLRLAFGSGSASAVVHGAVIVALAVVSATSATDRRPPVQRIEATLVPTADKQEILPKFLPQAEPHITSSVPSNASATAHGEGADGSGGGKGGGSSGGLSLAGMNLGPTGSVSGGTGLGTDDAFGTHMLGEIGEAGRPSATFFGLKADGRKFIFVVDTSGSMSANSRYLRCRSELLRSLGSMTYGQQYFVIFFNHALFAMPEHKLVDARPTQLRKTQEWVVNAVPAGGTEPWPGLQWALRLEPDAIYLLTDGQFSPQVVDSVINAQSQRSKKIPIHTIAFESPEGAVLLEQISRSSGGQHQFVP